MYQHLHRRFRDAPHGNVTIDPHKPHTTTGFSIVELLVVIVIIGILASITLVSYNGIQARARDTSVQSDIETMDASQTNYGTWHNAAGKNYYSGNGYDSDLAFTPSGGNVIDVVVNLTDYCIRGYNPNGTKNSIWNAFTKESSPGVCNNQLSPSVDAGGSSCPTGFIRVPGSSTYGTNAFCVMKYEAKNVGGVATSQAASTPWVSISQTDSITASDAACPGCHLISEARWLTVAQNVLGVTSNWNSGVVGNGYIYSGHNDSAPANTLAADPSDSNGYAGETNTGGYQKRTLLLNNGQVIWDLAGNVFEWTSGVTDGITARQPGIAGINYTFWIGLIETWIQWNLVTTTGTFPQNPSPAATGIAGAGTWNETNGVGDLSSNTSDTSLRGFIRGGAYNAGDGSGVLFLGLGNSPNASWDGLGYRVVR